MKHMFLVGVISGAFALLASFSIFISPGLALAETLQNPFRVSAELGNVGLLGDPGESGANRIGYGIGASYFVETDLAFDLQYIASNHPQVDHSALSVAADYYFRDFEGSAPYLVGGLSFIHNSFKNIARNGDAFAVLIGGGWAFDLSPNWSVGPELRFEKAFAAKVNLSGRDFSTVDDSYAVMARVTYTFTED